MKLNDFIILTAEKALQLQNKDGSFPAGHNGPYNDPETPVRNSSHWLITFAKCFEITGKTIFKKKVVELAEYLYSKDARPYGYSFYHRKKKTKDKCNGLIGQAWTFEALYEASKTLGDPKYIKLSEDVFFQHPFNENAGLWHCLEIDGKILPLDLTFNHQLWFAASISLCDDAKNKEIARRVNRFLDCLKKNVTVLNNGLIYHAIEELPSSDIAGNMKLKEKIINSSRQILAILKGEKNSREKMIYKSVGYHAFNMYAFTTLKQQIPAHNFWSSESFIKTLNYLLADDYKTGLDDNKYGYPYNPPGFEVPYSLGLLEDIDREKIKEISQWWLNEQIRRCYSKKTGKMDKHTLDPVALTARIYEATRLPNLEVIIQ